MKKNEITGMWTFSRAFDNFKIDVVDLEIEFTGNNFTGEVKIQVNGNFGTYSVNDSDEIKFNLNNRGVTFTGTWINDKKIGGTFHSGLCNNGTWHATRYL